MNQQLKSNITTIVNTWDSFNLSDVSGIIELRKNLSVYYYNLSEYKAQEESKFLTWETQRKNNFNAAKIAYIDEGRSATDAASRAEKDVKKDREQEVKHEREFKYARDIINSLSEILNAMSSAINNANNERKQSNYHT